MSLKAEEEYLKIDENQPVWTKCKVECHQRTDDISKNSRYN